MTSNDPLPSEPKLLMFSWVATACRKLLPASFRHAAGAVLFGVTPDIPVSLISTLSQKAPRKAFVYGAVIAFFFCFVVIAVWTSVVGTFQGSDPSRVYFREDKTNLIEYLIFCPSYVGLSAALVVLSCKSWVRLKLDPHLSTADGFRAPRLPLGIAFFVVIGLSVALTCTFISECLNPGIYAKTFWFISRVDSEGQRIIGVLGVYYSLLTYSLFLVIFSATVALVPVFAIAAEVGRCFRAQTTNAPASFDALRTSLSDFVSAYLVMKALTATLMLNAFTWRWSEQRHSFTLLAMGVVLTLVGLFFVAIPRYYVELEWYTLSVRRAQAAGEPLPIESADLRSRYVRLFAHFLDTLLIGSFFMAFWFN
jgi:hypothetical protein